MEKTDAATAIRFDRASELERTDCAPRTIAARSGATRHFDLEGALGPALRFRADRLTPAGLGVHVGTVRCPDTVGPDAYPLLDVSASGAFFELPSWHTLHDRQVLDRLIVDLEGVNLYDGRAIVARTDERSGRIVCGVAFDPYLGDQVLSKVARIAVAAREITSALTLPDAVHSKLHDDEWIAVLGAQFRCFLAGVRDAFDAAVPPGSPGDLEDLVVKVLEADLGPPFHDFIRRLNELPRRLASERTPAARRLLKALVQDLLMPAPIFRQSSVKPLGYAGDYLTMNIAYTNHYQGETAYAKYLNRMFCELAVSRAAISRLEYLRGWIDRVVSGSTHACTRILSIACGPAREIRDYLALTPPGRELVISLFDQDPRALAFAQSELAPFTGLSGRVRVGYVNGAVKQLVREPARFRALNGQHLIYTAGLFDYLRTEAAASLLKTLFGLLAPGGVLVVGNLSPRCDSQGFLENLVDWHMIYRTDEELEALSDGIPSAPSIEREPTGVNSFLVLRR